MELESIDQHESLPTAWQLCKDGLVAVPLCQIGASDMVSRDSLLAAEPDTAIAAYTAGSSQTGSSDMPSSLTSAVQPLASSPGRQSPNAASMAGLSVKLWQAASSASRKMAEDFAAAKQAMQEQGAPGESLQQKMAGIVRNISEKAKPTLDDVATKSAAMGSSIAARAGAMLDGVGDFDSTDAQAEAATTEPLSVADAVADVLGLKQETTHNAAAAAARTLSSWRSWGRQVV